MKRSIKKSGESFPSLIKKTTETDNTHVSFSFKYLDIQNPKFCIKRKDGKYFNKVVERLHGLSGYTPMDFRSNRSSSLRTHPIDFSETSEKKGFPIKNPELTQSDSAYQFEISANAHGRIHGLFIGPVFYVVWFDPDHKLYP